MFLIKVTSNGKEIGTLTAEQFMAYCGTKYSFLPTLVDRFNAEKERLGEPERAEIILRNKR